MKIRAVALSMAFFWGVSFLTLPAHAALPVSSGSPALLQTPVPTQPCASAIRLTEAQAADQLRLAHARLQSAPDDAQALLRRGLAYEALGRYGRATADFVRVLQLDPDAEQAKLGLGASFMYHGFLGRAVRLFSEVIRANPNSAEAYRLRADTFDALNSFGRSLADYNRAIALEPSDACTYYDRAITNLNAGFTQQALADFDRAIALRPEDAELRQMRAAVQSRLA